MQEISFERTAVRPVQPRWLWPVSLLAIVATPAIVAAAGYDGGWDSTVTGVAALVPLWLVIAPMVWWINKVYGVWLAFFATVALPQLGHLGEHIGQMLQIHWLDAKPPAAHGAVGALDIEWVHYLWNLLVLIGVMVLVMHFRRNAWLWATAAIGLWHFAEHQVIMFAFWDTGKAGDPGLLAKGGDIGGGLNIIRPDLHFIYNLAMTTPLMLAFFWQLRQSRTEQEERGALRSPL
jgi:hypothetical protein